MMDFGEEKLLERAKRDVATPLRGMLVFNSVLEEKAPMLCTLESFLFPFFCLRSLRCSEAGTAVVEGNEDWKFQRKTC